MNLDYGFQNDFLETLDILGRDVDKALVYSIHVLFNDGISHEKKQMLCDELARIGKELNGHISKFNLNEITRYSVREKEKVFVGEARALHGNFESFAAKIEKSHDVVIDKDMPFSISDIVEKLSGTRLYSDFSFTKDKVDNLLSVKKLIADIYRSRMATDIEKERSLDRQFVELKERAFNESVRSERAKNQIYCFRSAELIKKFITDGSAAKIVDADRAPEGNDVGFAIRGENKITIRYGYDGLSIEMNLEKRKSDRFLNYTVEGYIEKGVSKIEFGMDENVSFGNIASFERVTGIDFLWAHFEKAYVEYQHSRQGSGERQERLDKKIVDKAIDDLLFD
ncbi:MAG: hypothetical protein ACLQMF_18885 [Rectinemataceae bacterium]